MVSKFFDIMMDYCDEEKKNGNMGNVYAAREIFRRCEKTFQEYEKCRVDDENFEGKTTLEKLAMKNYAIRTHVDPDGLRRYEMDGRNFDNPTEIVEYLISIRNRKEELLLADSKKTFNKKMLDMFINHEDEIREETRARLNCRMEDFNNLYRLFEKIGTRAKQRELLSVISNAMTNTIYKLIKAECLFEEEIEDE